jgi:signal transduction histidine kinase
LPGRLIVEFPKTLKTTIRKAKRELRDLKKQLRDGTLDRKKLESGLKKIRKHVGEIPEHWEK